MRGTLVFEVFRLAYDNRPKILFLENVAGLLNHDGGRTFGTILVAMDELGYDAEWQLLNSKNFGVPQNRKRVFIIGHLRGAGTRKIFPLARGNGEIVKKAVESNVCLIDKKGNKKNKSIASCLTGGGHSGGNHSDMDLIVEPYKTDKEGNSHCIDANYHKGILARQDRTSIIEVKAVLTPDREEKRQNGRRIKDNNEPMFTLTTQDIHGAAIFDLYNHKQRNDGLCGTLTASGNSSTTHCGSFGIVNKKRIRRLIPKECFRLQGFPDEYFNRAALVNSDSQLYKQAGNSVTVNVIYEIARRLEVFR
jgi:DNA (cytosine-5)-methyltransferase 1